MPGDSERLRKVLSKVYSSQFASISQLRYLSEELLTGENELIDDLSILKEKGLVAGGRKFKITAAGRKTISVVMTGGSFDILHPGHLETLEKARALGDVLIVSVARDATFRRNKGRDPVNGESLRCKLVSSLKIVDAAVLGSEQEILETAVKISPNIIALGYDQSHSASKIKKELGKRGVKVKIYRLRSSIPGVKTSRILESSRSPAVV